MKELKEFTNLRVGGRAERLLIASSADEILSSEALSDGVRLVGGGTNILVGDEDVPGTTVIARRFGAPAPFERTGAGQVALDGFSDWPSTVRELVGAGLQGVESLAGIPGTVGGAVAQNIGAYGYEIADRLLAAEVVDLETGLMHTFDRADCGFSYRTSRFKGARRHLVTKVILALHPGGRHEVRYLPLAQALEQRSGTQPDYSIKDVYEAVLDLRRGKGMLIEPENPWRRTVGSFFTNPVVTSEAFEGLQEGVAVTIPHWVDPGGVKLSAAWLIESAGFSRGTRRGNVGLSPLHALAICNWDGSATCEEIVGLAINIREAVQDRWGVCLTPEVVPMNLDRTVVERLWGSC